jgi:hypothetical protein
MIRELKCPYGDDFEGGDECDRCEQYELCMETYPPLNLIEIPKGVTNGNMIKAMFLDCKDWKARLEDNDGEVYEVHFVQLPNSMTINKYEESWWNAPYKRGDLDDSN